MAYPVSVGASPGVAQQSAIGVGLGAKAATAFAWVRSGGREVVLRVNYAEQTPWATGEDRVVEAALLIGRRRHSSEQGWVRVALGPAWVIHSPGGQLKGSSTVGLAAQLDAVLNLGRLQTSYGWGLGAMALATLNSRASFFSIGVALRVSSR